MDVTTLAAKDLSAIQEIRFGQWRILPASGILMFNGAVIELEPLLFDLLCYLIINRDRIVSRQNFIDDVWQQKFVDDNAINRAISELRKILKAGAETQTAIKTHYKKGYSFIPEVELVPKDQTPSTSSKQESVSSRPAENVTVSVEKSTNHPALESNNGLYRKLTLKLIMFFAMAISVYVVSELLHQDKNTADADQVPTELVLASRTNLLVKRGIAFSPEVDSSHSLLAYSFKEPDEAFLSVNVKDLRTQTEFAVASHQGDLFPVAWNGKQQLIYQRIHANENELICQIWQADFRTGYREPTHTQMFDCDYQMDTKGSVVNNGNTLIYTRFNYRNAPLTAAIVARDLQNNSEYQLTSPFPQSLGDYYVKASPDESRIVFSRAHNGGTTLMLSDPDGSEQQALVELDYKVSSIAWNKTSDEVSWLNPTTWQLETLNITSGDRSRASLGFDYKFNQLMNIEVIDQHRIVFASDSVDSDIIAIDMTQAGFPITEVAASVSMEKQYVLFPGEETGLYTVEGFPASLWQVAEGVSRKVLELPFNDPENLDISPDGNQILLKNENTVYVYDKQLTLKTHFTFEMPVFNVKWFSEQRLLLIYQKDKKTYSGLYSLTDQSLTPLSNLNVIDNLRISSEKVALIDAENRVSVIDVTNGTVEQQLTLADTQAPLWSADSSYLYYTKSTNQIYRRDWTGRSQEEHVATFPTQNIRSLNHSNRPQLDTLYVTISNLGTNTLYDVQLQK